MADKSIIESVKTYLTELIRIGIPVKYGILFGSSTDRSRYDEWSDIDLLVVSPLYDKAYSRQDINILWKTAARVDNRIEPIAVGLDQWSNDDASTIIEIARREGITIAA
jgi:predicted nucleotidyltransferase